MLTQWDRIPSPDSPAAEGDTTPHTLSGIQWESAIRFK